MPTSCAVAAATGPSQFARSTIASAAAWQPRAAASSS